MLSKMATIIIRTIESKIEFETVINFDPTDMPYMCMLGYRMNCTSNSNPIELEKYWNIIDDFFVDNNLETSNYITLETIIYDDMRFGI
jgi:hypothetical protein